MLSGHPALYKSTDFYNSLNLQQDSEDYTKNISNSSSSSSSSNTSKVAVTTKRKYIHTTGNGYQLSPFTQQGFASFYHSSFHGKPTASGQPYSVHQFTAAHRTLPFGTKVKVTNKINGKSVVVVINDRGPWISKRVIDVSSSAAKVIGLLQSGVAPVKVETLNKNNT
jgi:rare lipoprotein A